MKNFKNSEFITQLFSKRAFLRCKPLLIFSFLFILFSINSHAQENLPLKIEGEKVDYMIKNGLVIAIDKASVEYEDIRIFADRIEINTNTEEIEAFDNVRYAREGNTITGRHLFYNFSDNTGYFEGIERGYFPPWYWQGRRIDMLSRDTFVLSRGSFSTCDREPPHYDLSCSSATLKLDEKATAKNVVFHLFGVPIFYFPYYYTYLQYTPYGLVNWVGHSEDKGFMDLAHYNWYVSDDFRGRVYSDYLENLGWGKGFDVDLKTAGGKNYLYGYYMKEDRDFYDNDDHRYGGTGGEPYERWKGIFKHRQTWDGDLYSILRLERYSDENFNKDFFSEERNKGFDSFPLSRAPDSFFSLEKVRPYDNTIFFANNALNDFEHITEREPSVTFSTRERKFESLPFFYKLDANYSKLQEVFHEDEDIDEDTGLERFDILGRVSAPHKIGRWLLSEPYLTARGTGYSENIDGEEVFRNTESAGWNFRTKLVRPYGEIQHIFQPQVGYYYRPEPSIKRSELIKLDPVDRITSQNGVYVEIINRLKTPKRSRAKEYESPDKLNKLYARENEAQDKILASSVRTYETDYREPFNLRVFSNYSFEDEQWESVFVENTLKSAAGFSLISDATYTPEKRRLEIVNSTLGVNRWDNFGGSLGVSYYRNEDIYYGSGNLWFAPAPGWEVQISAVYDIEDDFFRESGIYVKRPLHCWTAEFQVNSFKSARDEDYEFEVFLALSITEAPGLKIPLSGSITPPANE